MPELATDVERLTLVIEIGGMPVRVHTTDPRFLAMLQDRYAGFVTSSEHAEITFDVDLTPPQGADPDAPVRVTHHKGRWTLERGDFRAEWQPASRTGWRRSCRTNSAWGALRRERATPRALISTPRSAASGQAAPSSAIRSPVPLPRSTSVFGSRPRTASWMS